MSMMPLTAAFVIANRTVWEQAHACIQNLPVRLALEQGMEQSDPSEADGLLDRIERHRVDVVLIEASRVALPLEEFVHRLRNTAAQPAVFVLHHEPAPDLILEALRAGANEFLYPPLAGTLKDALERLSAARCKGGSDASNALGKMFGFLAARGGCGATTFVAHVAVDLARQMKQPVLLADFDFEAGLLRFLMKAKTPYSVRDALDNLHRMDSSLWKGLISSLSDRLDIIPSPEEVAAKRHPDREEITHLMRFIRSTYAVSIVDFGRSVSVAALDSLPELDALYIVTTPDAISLERTRRAVQMAEDRGFAGHRIKLLLNRYAERRYPNKDAIAAALGRPCDHIFRSDYMGLYDAYSEGRFLSTTSALGKELHALANSIRARAAGEREKEQTPAAAKPASDGIKRWLSFLQRPAARKEAAPAPAQRQGVQA